MFRVIQTRALVFLLLSKLRVMQLRVTRYQVVGVSLLPWVFLNQPHYFFWDLAWLV
jgi:hypothetical protein